MDAFTSDFFLNLFGSFPPAGTDQGGRGQTSRVSETYTLKPPSGVCGQRTQALDRCRCLLGYLAKASQSLFRASC